ncbi:MAG: deoxyguanosine kinase [Anaerolineaceae bacterium]|jgi:deoxyadenosine/deoxycytidine kinase|nr:deoxynucleoside kinase [Anaerolineae bacterium]MBL1172354.1 deoxynucleoside kinase [Chloroflexota bacterium]MBV6466756.1 Deoxyadenosine/deoxycytidine kinase [Anaerolineales bacterium]MCE7905923.1 deoxynucleoside kinase [Anaerolineae bacterium CFX3]MDL1925341.1 deoxynucleoside kinase [Anaerolineae bacterium AMX1]GER78419.1 deoxynucleoside kinase [Candidatus Denitrolinea symbiosum]GJQ40379.1 MAG: deoxyguanosine kinase [Anaerolineaceae bacterium]
MKKFVVVAGNIGVGKSTLVGMLCARLGWEPFYESVAENPYLADFYRDMTAWSFHSQVFFLTHRLKAHHELSLRPSAVIQDRSVYEDAEIFAQNLFLQGHIRPRDYQTYRELYETALRFLPPPDLVIYLRASVSTLLERITRRGRDYEQEIAPDYLSSLNQLYENWLGGFSLCPVLTVPGDDLDFVAHPGHLGLIVSKMQEKLTGRDEVRFGAEEVARAAED